MNNEIPSSCTVEGDLGDSHYTIDWSAENPTEFKLGGSLAGSATREQIVELTSSLNMLRAFVRSALAREPIDVG